jgi:hypothetical protein
VFESTKLADKGRPEQALEMLVKRDSDIGVAIRVTRSFAGPFIGQANHWRDALCAKCARRPGLDVAAAAR